MRRGILLPAFLAVAAWFGAPADAQLFGRRQVVVSGPTYRTVVVPSMPAMPAGTTVITQPAQTTMMPMQTYVRTPMRPMMVTDQVVRTNYVPMAQPTTTTPTTPTVVTTTPSMMTAPTMVTTPTMMTAPTMVMTPGRVMMPTSATYYRPGLMQRIFPGRMMTRRYVRVY